MLIQELIKIINDDLSDNGNYYFIGEELFKDVNCKNCDSFLSDLRTREHPYCHAPELYEEDTYHKILHNEDFLCKWFESKHK